MFSDFGLTQKSIPQKLSLLDETIKFDFLSLIPRSFTITTNSNSGNFNVSILSQTSITISTFLLLNPNQLQFHLDIQDERNILKKIEQIYQGVTINFEEDDLLILRKIINELQLIEFPNIKISTLNSIKFENVIIKKSIFSRKTAYFLGKDSSVQIDFPSILYDCKTNKNQVFTIQTKSQNYQCNIFGIVSSSIIQELLQKDPKINHYNYDFEDDQKEFKYIQSFFNFQSIILTKNNVDTIKEIAEDLKIDIILEKVNNFIQENEKVTQKIDDQQKIIDKIDDLYDLLCHIKERGVNSIVSEIKNSKWLETEKNVLDLAASILQLAETRIDLQYYLIDLIIQLNEDSINELKHLCPFIVNYVTANLTRLVQSTFNFSQENNHNYDYNFPFSYKMYKKGLIKKEKLSDLFKDCQVKNPYFCSWFFPELIEMNSFMQKKDFINNNFIFDNNNSFNFDNNINNNNNRTRLFYPCDPDKIEEYKKMRDNDEVDDEISKSLRVDDIDSFQSFISKMPDVLLKGTIKQNMFENFFVTNIRYLNYAAAYGSIKCFKYLLMNNEEIDDKTFEMSIIGGNNELIRIVDNKKSEKIDEKYFPRMAFGNNAGAFYNNINNKKSIDICTSNNFITRALYQAIKRHKNDIFDWILEEKFSMKKQNYDLLSLIYCSIDSENIHSLVSLIDHGFDFNSCSNEYSSFLEIASKKGFYFLLKFLINLINKNQNQPISIDPESTVNFGNIHILKLFIPTMKMNDIIYALNYAIKMNSFQIVRYVFEDFLKQNHEFTKFMKKDTFSLMIKNSFQNESDEMILYLIDKSVEFSNIPDKLSLFEILNKSVKSKKIEVTKKIIDLINQSKYILNCDFTEVISIAIKLNQIEVLKYIFDNKCQINKMDIVNNIVKIGNIDVEMFSFLLPKFNLIQKKILINQCFEKAIESNNKQLVKFLLKENPFMNNALIKATTTKDLEMVEIILENKNDPSFINIYNDDGTALFNAVRNDCLPIVKKLLSIKGIDPSLYFKGFTTPLIYSAVSLNIDIFFSILDFYGDDIKIQNWQLEKAIEQIINKDYTNYKDQISKVLLKIISLNCININVNCNQGNILTFACKNNLIEVVKSLLLNDEIDVNFSIPETGNTPLITSIKSKNYEIAKLLIENPKVNINKVNYHGESPLISIVVVNVSETSLNHQKDNDDKTKLNYDEIIKLIINNKNFDPEESNINLAFYLSDSKISKLLLSVDSLDVNYVPFQNNNIYVFGDLINSISKNAVKIVKTSLIKAILDNDEEFVDLLIKHPSFEINESQLLEARIFSFKAKTIKIFIKLVDIPNELNIDINSPEAINLDISPLINAINCRFESKIISLIINHPKFDSKKSDIVSAAFSSTISMDIFDLLYKFDCEHDHLIDKKINEEGNTILIKIAINLNFNELINFMLEHGVDPNKPDKNGVIPLNYFIENSLDSMSLALMKTGRIDFNKKIDPVFSTYLHKAAGFGRIRIIQYIISNDLCDFNAVNDFGETPLMLACKNGHFDCFRIFFSIDNLDFLHKNNNGDDALKLAQEFIKKQENNDNNGDSSQINEHKNDDDDNNKDITDKNEYLKKLLSLFQRSKFNF